MNNQDELKAQEIAQGTVSERTRNHPSNLPHIICVKDACLEMAAWKEQQMIEWLNENAWKYARDHQEVNTDKMIEDFKKAMEE